MARQLTCGASVVSSPNSAPDILSSLERTRVTSSPVSWSSSVCLTSAYWRPLNELDTLSTLRAVRATAPSRQPGRVDAVDRRSVSTRQVPRTARTKDLREALNNCEDDVFVEFIERSIEMDPAARLTPAQALRHPFIRRRSASRPHY